MLLLDKWFINHNIEELGTYEIIPEIEKMRKKQLVYCWKQNIDQTSSIIVNNHFIPEVYSISNLKYVLT